MTYKEWERILKKEMKYLPNEERIRILEYYRELYNDMTNEGKTEDEILNEFGLPKKCVYQMLGDGEKDGAEDGNQSFGPTGKKRNKFSAAELIGIIFFTVLLIFPLAAVGVAILISLGAITISGGAVSIAGLAFAVYYPFTGVTSYAMFTGIGMGIAASGIGLLLFIGAFFATKGMAIVLFKAFKGIYVRR